MTSITINPVTESRISLGITEADSEVIAKPGKEYGWTWQTSLEHMPIVQDRVNFVEAGLRAIKGKVPTLPAPVTKAK